jgi:O-antigen ligase
MSGKAVSALLPDYRAPLAGTRGAAAHAGAAADAPTRHNWLLYAFLFLLPLQNLQTGYMPNLGGGLNFLNVGFGLALAGALYCRGTITRWSSVHAWIIAYVAYACFSLYIGYMNVHTETDEHFGLLKDSMLAVMIVFVVQMSATDWNSIRRIVLVTLLPLPYILRVTWNQHASVSSWHYNDGLRISGTFSLLGANEYAAFCVTMAIVLFALLLAAKFSWRWRALLAAGIGCVVLGVLWSYSRTAYVALMLGSVAVILLWRARWKMIVPLIAAALLLPALLPKSVVERFDSTTIAEGQRDESTEMRFEFWEIAWNNFAEHPLFGSGYHTFHHSEINPLGKDTHNFFMRELTEKGLFGAMITFGMFLAMLRASWRTLRNSPPGGMAYALGLGMVGAWLALVIGNCFGDRFTYYPVIGYFWAYLGLMLKARELSESEREAAPAPPAAVPPPVRRYAQPRSAFNG